MSLLRSPRPTLTQLPDDILYELFKALEGIDPAQSPSTHAYTIASARRGSEPASLGWITLTHVCRRLRNIGINCVPTLWGRVLCVFPSEHAWKTAFERSKSAPLVLDLDDDRIRAVAPHPLPTTILSRALSIIDTIYGNTPIERKWWIDATLPHVVSLELSYELTSYVDYVREWRRIVILDGRISAPSLAWFRADGCFIPFNAPALRYLEIRHTVVWTMLLDSLRSCPLLEQLHLNDACEPTTLALDAPSQVALPRLEFICLYEPSNIGVCKVLDNLTGSSTMRIIARFCPSTAVFRNLLDRRRSSGYQLGCGRVLNISATRSSVDGTRTLRLAVADCRPPRDEDAPYKSDLFRLESRAHWRLEQREAPAIAASGLVNMLGEAFPPGESALDIRLLAFQDDEEEYCYVCPLPYAPDMMESLGEVLLALSRVEVLFVQSRNFEILKLLRDSLERAESPESPGTLFPELQSLFVDIRVVRLSESQWSVVVDILAYRKAAGRPLDRLVLLGTHLCHLSPDNYPGVTKLKVDLRPIKKLVGEVVDQRKGGKKCTCGKLC
ncbi:unnamed protein product [Peniophora sp. CBMAI 1063]|nr:unnamed protein product [Peniophora sp. CBMAI 1063]